MMMDAPRDHDHPKRVKKTGGTIGSDAGIWGTVAVTKARRAEDNNESTSTAAVVETSQGLQLSWGPLGET